MKFDLTYIYEEKPSILCCDSAEVVLPKLKLICPTSLVINEVEGSAIFYVMLTFIHISNVVLLDFLCFFFALLFSSMSF